MEGYTLHNLGLDRAYEDLLNGVADAVIAADVDGRVVLWNDAAEAMFGLARAEMLGSEVSRIIPERFTSEYERGVAAAFEAGKPGLSHLTLIARAADGTEFPAEVAVSIVGSENGALAVGIVRRLSERYKRLASLRQNERQLRDAEQLAGMGSFEWVVGSDEITWSAQLARIYGYEPGKHPRTLSAFLERVHPDDREALQNQIGRALSEGKSWSMEERIVRADTGEVRVLVSEVRAMTDVTGRVVRLCGICHDVTEQRQAAEALAVAEARVRHGALHDPLTGLPNRELLLDRLDGALGRAHREHTSIGLLLIDLDNFKIINDTIGHLAGDEILRTVAGRLLAAARTSDSAARVGGDEFVMICEAISHERDLLALAQRLTAMLSAPVVIGAQEFITNVSIGVAVGRGTEPPEQLLRDADLALYRAKQQGKNRVEMFDEMLRRHAFDRVEVERDLRRALLENEIEPFYQPIIDVANQRVIGFEALARWHHPERGLLMPDAFLAVAEEAHLIGALGATILRAACRQLSLWQQQHPSLTMAVNLSPRQLDADFPATVADILREQALDPRTLHMEVTETVLLDMQKSAMSHLNELAGLGVQLGIDDFGTGYSSLLYLKRFPVRFLKIDRSFVDGLPDNQEDTAIVTSVVQLGKSLELTTIAEGVETIEQFDSIRELGCANAQGYYFSRPASAAECDAMLAAF